MCQPRNKSRLVHSAPPLRVGTVLQLEALTAQIVPSPDLGKLPGRPQYSELAYRFFFYSNEEGEPPHVHIQRDRMLAKFWLNPPILASSTRFSPQELRKLEVLVNEIVLRFWRLGMGTLAVELHPFSSQC